MKIDHANPDRAGLDEAADILAGNVVIVAPTETRYGLLARADMGASVEKIYHIKKRNPKSPISVMLKTVVSFLSLFLQFRSSTTLQKLRSPTYLSASLRGRRSCEHKVAVRAFY